MGVAEFTSKIAFVTALLFCLLPNGTDGKVEVDECAMGGGGGANEVATFTSEEGADVAPRCDWLVLAENWVSDAFAA
jgi:hypothetical protein